MNRFFILLSLLSSICFSQKKTDFELLYSSMDEICEELPKRELFCKITRFYKEEQYDSCIVFSSRLLLTNLSARERNIINYIQGVSAQRKNIFRKALHNFNEITKDSLFNNLKKIQLGYVHMNLEDYNKAITVLKLWEENNTNTDIELLKDSYINLATCYSATEHFKKAEKYYGKALSLISKKDTLSIIKVKIDLANSYYNQYLDEKAISLFKEVYDMSSKFSDVEMKKYTSRNMGFVEENRKNYKKSVQYYLEEAKWTDSLYNRDKIWQLAEKDKQVSLAQKQSEIALQNEQLKRQKVQRDSLVYGVLGLLVFIGGLGFLYKKLQKQNTLITKQKEELNTANKTKDYLFSVVSHDLRSPINTIKRQHVQLKEHIANKDLPAITATNNKAIAVTESTSHLLNNVLHWSLEQSSQLLFSPQEIALRPIVQHVLFDYKMLVEANNISIASELENALVKADKESVKIVLRNLLDNAVKYGGEEILVSTGISSGSKTFIKVKDNGVGITKEKLDKINALTNLSIDKVDRSQGIGLGVVLCHTLVKKNNGVLTFASEPNEGTTVTIELPSEA